MVGNRGVVSWDMASEFSYDNWHFFTTTYDGLELKMYINGREIYSEYISLSFTNNTSPLHIGRDIPGQDEYFCGKLDDIQIFDRKLSSKDVKKMFKDTDVSVKVYDEKGRSKNILFTKNKPSQYSLNLTGISKGIKIIRITTDQNTYNKKIIKN